MPRALILGGTGAIGRATTRRLLAMGWRVDVTGRDARHLPADLSAAGVRFLSADRHDHGALCAALGEGADLIVDCLCYSASDAEGLLPLVSRCASAVMISTKAVYVDSEGRHANSAAAPRFDGAVPETQPTVAPTRAGADLTPGEAYAANKVAAERMLLDSGLPVTVLRPSLIHGVGARPPREWVFVKRALDGRRVVVLARRGAGVDHTTAAANIAALIGVVASNPGQRVLNIADPDAPSALQISRVVARLLEHDWKEILLEGEAQETVGRHPWDRPHAIVLDTTAAMRLGYVPVGDYATTVREEIDWLAGAARSGPGSIGAAADDAYFAPLLDYAAEERFLAREIRSR